ncbi:MAG: hypothetical protein JXN59_14570 [Anaerolineae bacterium]|nr:hypothetical protein [Anaerolineae bacterium]
MDEPGAAPLQDWVFSYLSHELRTPLSAMLGFSQMLLDGVYGEVNEKQKDRLERVVRSSQMLLRRLDLLLDYQRLFQQDLDFSRHVVSAHDLVQDSLAATSYDNRGRSLQIMLPDNAADVFLQVNRLWAAVAVREVLLYAATEARPDPTVWIYVRPEYDRRAGVILIRYHAPAMDAWRWEELFQINQQGGIGLPLALELLSRMAGSIEYESAATRHEITISLPLVDKSPGET